MRSPGVGDQLVLSCLPTGSYIAQALRLACISFGRWNTALSQVLKRPHCMAGVRISRGAGRRRASQRSNRLPVRGLESGALGGGADLGEDVTEGSWPVEDADTLHSAVPP